LFSSLFLLALAAGLFATAVSSFADRQHPDPPNVVEVVEAQRDKVVSVRIEGMSGGMAHWQDFFNQKGKPEQKRQRIGRGSGFIISEDGLIVTSYHVVKGATQITVQLSDGKTYQGRIIGRDEKTDIALLQVDADRELPTVSLGDSDRLTVGEWVVAIGSPFGLDYSVTAGVVSAKGRQIGHSDYDNFLQTDASINPGNSGGPLFNLNGEVVGVNGAIMRRGQGIGFSVPSNTVSRILPDLKKHGYVIRGYIGAGIQGLTANLAHTFGADSNASGVLVSHVKKDGPADAAGIEQGDIIRRYNSVAVDRVGQLLRVVGESRPGSRVDVEILRDGEPRTLQIEVGTRDSGSPPESRSKSSSSKPNGEAKLGVEVAVVNEELAERLGLDKPQGLLVKKVLPNSPANDRIQPGDVLLKADGTSINSIESLKQKLDAASGDPVRLYLERSGRRIFVAVEVK
jgi:serine protease Do